MAIAEVRLPNGNIGEFRVPDGLSDSDVEKLINQYISSNPSILGQTTIPEEKEDSGDFIRGLKQYVPTLKETLGGAQVVAGKALGSEETMESGIQNIEEAERALLPLSRPRS